MSSIHNTPSNPPLPPKPNRLPQSRSDSLPPANAGVSSKSFFNSTDIADQKLSSSKYRERVVNEIYDTEFSYVSSMEHCCIGYYIPLTTSENIKIPLDIVNTIFLHFSSVLNINKVFLENMTIMKKEGTLSTELGAAFNQFVPFLNVYKLFLGNSDNCLQALAEFEKKASHMEILDILQNRIPSENQLDLRSYLIMPVQRLPRYRLLLTDLLKHTEDDFVDKPRLEEALDKIATLATLLNEIIKERSRNQKLVELINRIDGLSFELVSPFREYLLSGSLTKVCRKENKERFFYLFNDTLIYGIGDEKKMKVSEELPLELLMVESTDTYENAFQLLSKKSFSVIAPSNEKRNEWVKIIQDAIQLHKSKLGSLQRDRNEGDEYVAPVWVQDTTNCQVCDAKFTALFRKHHCRKCGACICSNCSKHTIIINKKKERVCDKCAEVPITDSSKHKKSKSQNPIIKELDSTISDKSKSIDSNTSSLPPLPERKYVTTHSNINNSNDLLTPPPLPPKKSSNPVGKDSRQITHFPAVPSLRNSGELSPRDQKIMSTSPRIGSKTIKRDSLQSPISTRNVTTQPMADNSTCQPQLPPPRKNKPTATTKPSRVSATLFPDGSTKKPSSTKSSENGTTNYSTSKVC
ncbi:Rho guanine nucleotide exchange factor [Entamoeba marina]